MTKRGESPNGIKAGRLPKGGRLQVECICGRGFCWLPAEEIGLRTGPCSRRECQRLYEESKG